ncbi:urea ABC transporter permease subunit UrtB [Hyphomicrobium sp. CS1BSMeth3]|uniref:urea ABC transporter permease subunit UrtB n=1 Tax=Hyphomicrobium sp. CS1BSMeth3 TaxID=1892844 RepID=UPI0009FAA210|nr:urea ABC transporter permease subunit UrtB [Hyphomicrobium sp. CS1BSMeth3]
MGRLIRLLLLMGSLLVAGAGAPQQAAAAPEDLAAGLALIAKDSFNDTITGIYAIARSGAPHSAALVEALHDRRLLIDTANQKVFYRDTAGAVRDAQSNDVVATPPANLTAVRLNNRVRSAASAALGALSLMNPDPARRIQSAQAVMKSRDPAALPVLEAAIAAEKLPNVRKELQLAWAAVTFSKSDAPLDKRQEAVALLRDAGTRDAVSVLRSLPADTAAPLREATTSAITSIEQRLALWGYAQNIWYGISLGSVLLIAAIGLAITFGVMGVINMAHGEMVMLGAYTTFVVQEFFRTSAPGLFDYSLAVAIPLAFLVAGGIGVAIERGVIRHLYGRPLETLLATWGISLILQQAVRTTFGPTNREVGTPQFMSGAMEIGGLVITWNRLYIVIFAGLIFVGLLLALRYTPLGLHMRAVTQNRRMASSMGIRTGRVDALTFGLGSGIAGLAGVALSQIDNVSPNLGQSYIIDSFLVVVFGGVGNLWGTLVGALSIGMANKLLEPYAGAVLGKIILLVAIIFFIQKRPRGLFALKGRAVEA